MKMPMRTQADMSYSVKNWTKLSLVKISLVIIKHKKEWTGALVYMTANYVGWKVMGKQPYFIDGPLLV